MKYSDNDKKKNQTSQLHIDEEENKVGNSMVFIMTSLFHLVVLTWCAHCVDAFTLSIPSYTTNNPPTSTTSLWVSEVHVPGYKHSKIPFILTDDDTSDGGMAVATRIQERTYTQDVDYTSLVPFQDGHMVHKTTGPVFTREECNMIIGKNDTATGVLVVYNCICKTDQLTITRCNRRSRTKGIRNGLDSKSSRQLPNDRSANCRTTTNTRLLSSCLGRTNIPPPTTTVWNVSTRWGKESSGS